MEKLKLISDHIQRSQFVGPRSLLDHDVEYDNSVFYQNKTFMSFHRRETGFHGESK